MGKQEDIWYAVNVTKVIHSPQLTLETFGTTTIRYHFLSELMDEVNKVRVREGSVYSERPQIITPSHFATQLLDGFGDKAQEYADWMLSHGEMIRILKYGLHFRKDKIAEELIAGSLDDVSDRIRDKVASNNDNFSAVIVGADELWEVSLLKFVVDYIQQSAAVNLQELAKQPSQNKIRISSQGIREEIEAEFSSASKDRSRIDGLGKQLQKYGLFEEYEDKFYELVRKFN